MTEVGQAPLVLLIVFSIVLLLWVATVCPDLMSASFYYLSMLMVSAIVFLLRSAGLEIPLYFTGLSDEPYEEMVIGVCTGALMSAPVITGLIVFPPVEVPVHALFLVLVAPIVEEIFFRGFLLTTLVEYLGLPVGIFLQALAFSLFHMAWVVRIEYLIPHFFFGLVLGYLVSLRGSLDSAILAHLLYNLIGVVM